MSDENHELHLIGPITLSLTKDAFDWIHAEFMEQMKPAAPLPTIEDVVSSVLNKMAAALVRMREKKDQPHFSHLSRRMR